MTAGTPEPVLAREFDLDINTGTIADPVWTPIGGITGITPGQTVQNVDVTDFDTDGWEDNIPVQRGKSLSVAINYKENGDADLDPGQEALIALGDAMGSGAKKQFRHRSPNGRGHTFLATCAIAWPGGEKTANSTCTAELTMRGKPTPIVEPSVPVITSVTPNEGDIAGGTEVVISGHYFTDASAVTFGGVAATDLQVNSSIEITCTTPAHAAGAVAVQVTTPDGVGSLAAAFTYA